MMKAEAIAMLKRIQEPEAWEPQINQAAFEALDMAIKALERQSCEDAISRKAIVEYIKASDADLGHDSENELVVEDILTMPPVTPTQKWIPCSERLPETEEFVLASLTGKYRNTTFEHACEIADYVDGGWWVYAYPHMSAEKCEELIEAWMPLPKPFEGGIK